MKGYIDLHTHTSLSDGKYPPKVLIDLAAQAGITTLAITDHNCFCPNFEELRLYALEQGITLLNASEISCMYTTASGQRIQLHVIALNCDPKDETLYHYIKDLNAGQRHHVSLILKRLKNEFNMELGTYDTLLAKHPHSLHVGRVFIAEEMVERGYVESINDAFDIYIGAHGLKKAYVENPTKYPELEDIIYAIHKGKGIPILAHFYYYQLSNEDNLVLLQDFKNLCGEVGAMEVLYSIYTEEQRETLAQLAIQFDLMPSAASDYHGQHEDSTLCNQFPYEIYERLENKRKEVYGE